MKIKEILSSKPKKQTLCINGWVRNKRGSKNVVFISMNDGSTINNLQVVVDAVGAGP